MTTSGRGCERAIKGLTPEQLDAVIGLVGTELAREDEPAVAQAFSDFRIGMDELRQNFDAINTGEPGGEND